MTYSIRFYLTGFIALVMSAGSAAVAQAPRVVRATVNAVTVFRDRAQLTATARATVEAGTTELVVANLPAGLDAATVQVQATTESEGAALTLLGVEVRADYTVAVAPRTLATLQDSLHGYEAQVRALLDQKEVLQKEEAALVAAISQGKVDADDLEEAAEFFRNRATAIRALIQRADARLTRLQPMLGRWTQQVERYEGPRLTPPGQLAITLAAEQHAVVALTLTYVTTDAGWAPVYDLRATAAGSGPVQLVYKAAVQQSTGSDWRNVRLTLSGGAPVVGGGGGLPELRTEYVRVEEPYGRRRKMAPGVMAAPMAAEEREAGFTDSGGDSWGAPEGGASQAAAPPPTTAGRDGSAIRFELADPYSVPADGRPHTVEVQRADLPATYGLTVVPKLDETAFLTAAVTGWEQYNLLPGRANTYLDGTFTGAFDLDPARAVDTLRLTLGPDRNVLVHREKSSEFSKRALLGGTVRDAVSYVITAKNMRPGPVGLRVEEMVPRAADSRVSVETTDLSGGHLDDATGRVMWQSKLQAGETRAWKLAYEIKYPKKTVVQIAN